MGLYLDRDLRRTQFVLAVARDLHFGKAAARLNIAQSYLSRAVKEFENERGYLFFERNGESSIQGFAVVVSPGRKRTLPPRRKNASELRLLAKFMSLVWLVARVRLNPRQSIKAMAQKVPAPGPKKPS